MKLNLKINNGRARPRSGWSHFIEVELPGARDAGSGVLGRLAREWGDATTSFTLLVGGPAGHASLVANYGGSRFVAVQKSRQVMAWLRNRVGALSVAAGTLDREAGHD
ncbi:MAG: hypothetical protein K0Q68_1556 [Moraxellaceae bacterium]|jgi:hypothetical protein|nr:hypothetical protein [Moraxellaceae bacterium]